MQRVTCASGAMRLTAARDFVLSYPAATEILLVGATRESVDDFVRTEIAVIQPTFGLHRYGFFQLVAHLAAAPLARSGRAPATRLGTEAVAARAGFAAWRNAQIPRFSRVAHLPGFSRALASTLQELRMARVQDPLDPDLRALLQQYEKSLNDAAMADRALLLLAAREGLLESRHAALRSMPLLLLDVTVRSPLESALLGALSASSPAALATIPVGDVSTTAAFDALGGSLLQLEDAPAETGLRRLRRFLFAGASPPEHEPDEEVLLFSAPGEGRECIEIARQIQRQAAAAVPFDAMAVFLRAPEAYSTFIDTALRRAGIPAYFSRGTKRPDPAGRAFLALLACASERLSARRFAEYLSFAQVPRLDDQGAPPEARPVWPAPRAEECGTMLQGSSLQEKGIAPPESAQLALWDMGPFTGAPKATPKARTRRKPAPSTLPGPRAWDRSQTQVDAAPEGALRAPWKWEELLVEAAVIGGRDRWRRRLAGLHRELQLKVEALQAVEPESPRLAALQRDLAHLGHLERFALPLIDALDALPRQATWGEWVQHLSELAPRALRVPERVLAVLGEMHPMADVGPVEIEEVRNVLTERLSDLETDPPEHRFGRVFVGTPDQARGRRFRIVFIPGLAERIFPQRPREDPLLLDAMRRKLAADLPTQEQRIADERLLLGLAIGAAEEQVVLSYPRLDAVEARPRVPSFYALDTARAVRGRIPDFRQLEREAAVVSQARLAWPAPPDADDAIDTMEHDLATLGRFLHGAEATTGQGRARYLLQLNPHLARSLRSRYLRWLSVWRSEDGLVRNTPQTEEFMTSQRPNARPYSVTALQRFAVCPYQFLLAAIHRLEPRRQAAPMIRLDPLTKGRIFHHVQAETLRTLRDAGRLPTDPKQLEEAQFILESVLERLAAQYRDDLAPAIERIWEDELSSMRGDLRRWLRVLATESSTWRPLRFELAFGLGAATLATQATGGESLDPASTPEPARLPEGWLLRGAVDLVEERVGDGALRVTDHKTGTDRTWEGLVVGGGEVLQPALYALAVEALQTAEVVEGRLFFCTSRGRFSQRIVPLGEFTRRYASDVLQIIDGSVSMGFLPPAPRAGACAQCDFRPVCGPHEEIRAQRKSEPKLDHLSYLRELP